MIEILVAIAFSHVYLPATHHDEDGSLKGKIKDHIACEVHECDSCRAAAKMMDGI
jgi:hypothetical protein